MTNLKKTFKNRPEELSWEEFNGEELSVEEMKERLAVTPQLDSSFIFKNGMDLSPKTILSSYSKPEELMTLLLVHSLCTCFLISPICSESILIRTPPI